MIIGQVVSAVTLNPEYSEGVPAFVRAWRLLFPAIAIHIVVVGAQVPASWNSLGANFYLLPPALGMAPAYMAQFVRLLVPGLLNDSQGAVIITDIDMMPMNRRYYTEPIKNIADNQFVVMRSNAVLKHREYPMCYNVALPSTWREIFWTTQPTNLSTSAQSFKDNIDALNRELRARYPGTAGKEWKIGCPGWCTDQRYLFNTVNAWRARTKRATLLVDGQTRFARLDRIDKKQFSLEPTSGVRSLVSGAASKIQVGTYCDYHMLRPYSKHARVNERVLEILAKNKI